jgi:hypothetical protein
MQPIEKNTFKKYFYIKINSTCAKNCITRQGYICNELYNFAKFFIIKFLIINEKLNKKLRFFKEEVEVSVMAFI